MGLKLKNLQQRISQNRLLLWWIIFLPLLTLIVIFNWNQLTISPDILRNEHLSFQYKVFNSLSLIFMARISLIAIGLLIVMLCLFFPVLRVSKAGIQWNKEMEEVLNASGEITGEEISELIKEESRRWTLIYGWLKIGDQEQTEPGFLLREMLATVWTAFPESKLSLSCCDGSHWYAITHHLLPKLVLGEVTDINSRVEVFRLEWRFAEGKQLFLDIHPGHEEVFSRIDEGFMLILEEIFKQEIIKRGFSVEQLIAYFDKEILT